MPHDTTIRFVSVVLPCLNEEQAVGRTVQEALSGLALAGVPGEVLVVDNGSSDASAQVASEAGARVIREARPGYGAALRAGIAAAAGDVVIMADADCTYDLEHLGDLLAGLRAGADLVIANRLQGELSPAAMPLLHRRLGTPAISLLVRLLTGTRVSDSQSGYRAFWREAALALELKADGMEFASEMLVKAGWRRLRIAEVPSRYRERVGESKLSTFSDGWRHLLMLLLLSPHMTLILPGAAFMGLGALLTVLSLLMPSGITVGSLQWFPVYLSPVLLIIGAQSLLLGAIEAYRSPLTPERLHRWLRFLARKRAVDELLAGYSLVVVLGLLIDAALFIVWLLHRSGGSFLGLAGLAQACIVIGACGLCTVLAADYARNHLGW